MSWHPLKRLKESLAIFPNTAPDVNLGVKKINIGMVVVKNNAYTVITSQKGGPGERKVRGRLLFSVLRQSKL